MNLNDYDLDYYKSYLEELALNKSSEIFSNGGKDFASILMSVLFQNTRNNVRMFCHGFKPDLITTIPYWDTLIEFLKDKGKNIKILCETNKYLKEKPLATLATEKAERNDESIIVKLITEEDMKEIIDLFGHDCNFSIFDNDKFRFETDPNDFIAFGSFNRPDICENLIRIFDKAFVNSNEILV